MKKRVLSLVLVAAMAITSLIGCGGSSSSDSAETTEVAEADASVQGDSDHTELKVGAATAAQNISPFTNFTNRQPINHYIYETLIDKDADGNYFGVIAKDWTTEDNITYHFEIYDYVTDTAGNNITASDCVYSLEHSRDEASTTWVVSAEVTGDYTFDVVISDNTASSFTAAMQRSPIVSQKAYEESTDQMATSVVSTAPYVVTDFVSNVSITLERNENYWQTDEELQNPVYKNMTVDKLSYTKIAEAAQQTIALETGAVDVFEGISNTEVANFLEGGRDAANFTALGYASPLSYIFYFSNTGIMAEDIELRKAVTYAIDKDTIIQGALDGLAVSPTFYGAPDGLSDLTPTNASEDYMAYDADKAAEALANSSYSGEQIRLLVPNEDSHSKIASIIQGQLMAIGLDVAIETYDNAMFQSNLGDGSTWDIAICQMGMADVAFVWDFLSWDLMGGDAGSMGMGLKDDTLTGLLQDVSSVDGHTNENATKVTDYINENFYGENLASMKQYWIYRKGLNATEVPYFSMMNQVFYTGSTVFE